jgi:hypothetical protein
MSANPYDVIAEEVRGLGSKIEHMEDCLNLQQTNLVL